MDETAQYLPRLLAWVNDKIVFWQSELGSNLVQGNPKVGARRSFAVTSSQEKKQIIIIEEITIAIVMIIIMKGMPLVRIRQGVFFVGSRVIPLYSVVVGLKMLI